MVNSFILPRERRGLALDSNLQFLNFSGLNPSSWEGLRILNFKRVSKNPRDLCRSACVSRWWTVKFHPRQDSAYDICPVVGHLYESEGTLSSCGHNWERRITSPLSLVWAELVLCILGVDLCCSRAPVSIHKLLKSTDCRVASRCGVVHDWGEVPLTVLGGRTLSTHGNLERMEVSQRSHEPLYFLPSQGVIRQQSNWNFVSCPLGGKVSSWTYLPGRPSFPGLCTLHIRLPRWVTDVVQASFSFFLLFFPFSIFLWIIWQGDGWICLETLF